MSEPTQTEGTPAEDALTGTQTGTQTDTQNRSGVWQKVFPLRRLLDLHYRGSACC